jgi:hypothetical protein
MIKRNSTIFTIITVLLFFYGCKNEQKTELNPQWDYDNITAIGELKTYTYTFCSITAKVLTDTYKTGAWTFYTPQKVKIAEGTFNPELIEIDDHGDCSYWLYTNPIDAKNWTFWDSNGKPTPTNKRDLDYIVSFN